MKKLFYSLLIATGLLAAGALSAKAGEVTAQAVVLKVSGSVQATLPGQGGSVAVKAGDQLPQGAILVTGANASVDVQAFNGAVATITHDTTASLEKLSVTTTDGAVTKQTALINLKVGTVLSRIDPAKHAINDYGVRTPRGVAAARGTAYAVSVTANGSTQIFVTQSQVTFTNTTTGATTVVPTGAALMVLPEGGMLPITADQVKTIQDKLAAGDTAGANQMIANIATAANLSGDNLNGQLVNDTASLFNSDIFRRQSALTSDASKGIDPHTGAPEPIMDIPAVDITVVPQSPSN